MKAKHLLFGSIFLSMGFAACTNEVEELAPQAQDKDFPGVELGKDFSISVTNADFSADAATRAAFEKVGTTWVASWQENDAIGAAWFNKFVYDNTGKVVSVSKNVYTSLGEYGSNAEFVWQGGTTFKSEATSKLGAYVLYYPYNEKITDNMTEIPVVGIPATQPFDVQNPTNQVTANMTAANVVVFGESGDQAPKFTVKQVPNLYALSFFITDEALLKLDQKVQITHVMLEAENHTAVFNTAGTIAPSSTDIEPDTYNGVNGADPMPVITFKGATEKADRIIIEVANKGNNSDYYIRNTGKDNGTAKFYFSLLPTEKLTSDVTFKIIGKVREGGKNVTKVFAKKVELTDAHKAKDTGFAWKMSDKGQVINLAVELDNTMIESGIYSEEQFVENWVAGDTEFNLAVPMDLTKLTDAQKKKVNFTLPADKHVVFNGEKVTLPAINGMYTFNNEVEINGDATLKYCPGCENGYTHSTPATVFAKTATINGNVTSYGNHPVWFRANATINGNVTDTEKSIVSFHGGNVTINGNYTNNNNSAIYSTIEITGAVKANGTLDFMGYANIGDLTAKKAVTFKKAKTGAINADAEVTFADEVESTGAIVANKNVTFTVAKKIASLEVNEGAEVVATSAVVEGALTINKGVVTIPTLEVADATIELEGELFAATKFDAKGTVNANGLIDAKGGKINTLNITPNITVNLEDAEITTLNNKKTASYSGTLNITNGTIKDATNNGTIVGNYTVTGTFAQNADVTGNNITVAEGATFVVNANTNADITNNGTVTINTGKVLKDVTAITNNGTINANGTLKEVTNVTLAAKSKVIVGVAGKVNLIGATQPGEVNVQNGSQLTYASQPAKVSYVWNGTAPDATVENVINYYNIKNASALTSSKFNDNSTIDLAGTMSIKASLDFGAKNIELIVSENSTIAQGDANYPAQVKNLTLTSTGNSKVKSGATLTVSDLINLTAGTLKLESGAEFVGNPGGASVTH